MMKNLLSLLGFLFATLMSAQAFTLTPDNFRTADNKDYIVISVPGKNQNELFTQTKKYLHSKYKGMKWDGYNEVENEQIVLDLNEQSAVIKGMGSGLVGNGLFTNRYVIIFKDEKIRVEPSFISISVPDGAGGLRDIGLRGGNSFIRPVFDKKGKLLLRSHIYDGINNKTNQFSTNLIEGIKLSDEEW